jgi:hypothetical protein
VAEALPRPLQYPPAVRPVCACGKDGSGYAHGAIGGRRPFTCAEVLEIRAVAICGQLRGHTSSGGLAGGGQSPHGPEWWRAAD